MTDDAIPADHDAIPADHGARRADHDAIPAELKVPPGRTEELRDRLAAVEERIAAACRDAGRDRDVITLVVVTKFFPAADVLALARLGVRDIGESRDPEAGDKLHIVRKLLGGKAPRLHFIGQLQSNKAARIGGYADLVHSVDRPKVVAGLARGAATRERPLDTLIQVDLDGSDPGRGGAPLDEVTALADLITDTPHLALRGLMAVAPLGAPAGPAFERLAAAGAALRANHPEATWISAGMSGDLEQAVAAGSTCLRVGSAILGSRPARG